MMKTELTQLLGMKYPIIMAPMFLVTNEKMVVAATKAGIAACIPAHNFRSVDLLAQGLASIKKNAAGPVGVNLVANKANIKINDEIQACIDNKVEFIISALGSPSLIIEKCKPKGIKVFCDVIDADFAKKAESMGADALIAVNSGAGGHLGQIPASVLIPMLKKQSKLPIISAGGVATGAGIVSMLALGASGVSIGSAFIPTVESGVNEDYKNACLKYGAKDIVITTKISGTPCTVINTPYVKKIGTEQNVLESFLNNHKTIKKYAKMITYLRGAKLLEKAAFGATYKSVWCAGASIEFINEIKSIENLVGEWVNEMKIAKDHLDEQLKTIS